MPDPSTLRYRSPLRRLTGVRIAATGSFAPERVVTNDDLAPLGYDAEWVFERTGIRERRWLAADLATSDMAIAAARRCLASADVSPDDIDLVIVGTFTPDMQMPATACRVQHELGLSAGAFDLQAACSGFVYSLATAAQFIAAGTSRACLVIGTDCNSRIAQPNDMKTYPLFGDAAGAVLLTKGEAHQGLTAYTLGADGAGAELLCRPMGGSKQPLTVEGLNAGLHYLHMDGRPVFKWAVRLIAETVRQVTAHAGLSLADLDLVIMHQANLRIIDAAAADLEIDRRKVFINLDRYGNTSAASIPLALDEAVRQGRVVRGSRVLLCGFGGGLSWGTALVTW